LGRQGEVKRRTDEVLEVPVVPVVLEVLVPVVLDVLVPMVLGPSPPDCNSSTCTSSTLALHL